MRSTMGITILLSSAGLSLAAEPKAPSPAPTTRPAMKQSLEDLKHVQPRLPLPSLTAEEKADLGGRPVVNNSRMRQLYLPSELRGSDFFHGRDPAMTLDPTFKTMLFWIVSRVNNCRY